ncbi:hypothetical protein Scep_024354 [Stephania cephalantha]|uniref:Uncharacterized protein n=1 Tax=Stephania cephalantha TaxID=152367 RepID=A0AAP0EX11_9MAGN
MSFAIYEAWCRKAAIRYTGNIYLIAKKRKTPIYLTNEVFEHYKRTRATDEAFKKKFEQMSANRRSEVGGPGTSISLHSARSISVRQHGDTLAELTRRVEELSTQSSDTPIDEDAAYFEVVPKVKDRVYGLGSQATKRSGPQRIDIRDGVYVVDIQHLTTDRSSLGPHSFSQFAHLDDHQPEHLTDPRRELLKVRQQFLDDDEEFMLQLMSPTRPPPWQE